MVTPTRTLEATPVGEGLPPRGDVYRRCTACLPSSVPQRDGSTLIPSEAVCSSPEATSLSGPQLRLHCLLPLPPAPPPSHHPGYHIKVNLTAPSSSSNLLRILPYWAPGYPSASDWYSPRPQFAVQYRPPLEGDTGLAPGVAGRLALHVANWAPQPEQVPAEPTRLLTTLAAGGCRAQGTKGAGEMGNGASPAAAAAGSEARRSQWEFLIRPYASAALALALTALQCTG